jgi:transposase InsO family protein
MITHVKQPFEMISIDFLGPLPLSQNGNKYILVISDYLTRWPEAFVTADMKATTVAKILVDEIICRHSAPQTILSDQGREFMAEIVKQTCDYFKANKINTTAYHPQTNGLTEKFKGTLCKMLSAYANENQTN